MDNTIQQLIQIYMQVAHKQRFGQFLINITNADKDTLFYMSNEQLLKYAKQYMKEFEGNQ